MGNPGEDRKASEKDLENEEGNQWPRGSVLSLPPVATDLLRTEYSKAGA